MAKQKSKARTFNQMSYRDVQRANSQNRGKLNKDDQKWLKENNYKNVGWENVILLYQKIEEFLDKQKYEDFSLEELFLEADHIGNKYQTSEEIAEFNRKLSEVVSEISEEVDKQFPDTEIEVIDCSSQSSRTKQTKKTYRTIKL
jgi:hypothetical protein